MPARRVPLRPLVLAATVAAVILASPGESGAEPRSARICGACHGPLRRQWERSAHGTSWTNPVFQAFLADAKKSLGSALQPTCVACHAPAAHVMGDPNVTDPLGQEGVTCNFCHNVSAVEASTKPASYIHDAANPNLMRGPYRDADPAGAHDAIYSEIHTKSEFCAACHSAAHPKSGVIVEPTYLDWKRSSAAAQKKPCQECHMPPTAGRAATVTKRTRSAVYAHTFSGPRTMPGWLDSTATMTGAVETGRLRLEVANRKAGHALPGGGNSMRTITLDVTFRDAAGSEVSRVPAERFGVEFADADGSFPVPKWIAHSVARSTSIPADSSRVVWCDLPPGAKSAEAVLTYHAIHPAYRARLEAQGVDLSGRAPVVLARTTVAIP